ncbi:MAG: multidrug ABC transporter substrate-binding protein [Acidobacteria bacterium]|nr:MAG: multidrug ABC transporter substrate-binding protein [Acidobacteriota bacterium]
MDWMEVFRLAMRALARNKMRSALTMLGIIIGVGAVIASVAVGEGAANEIQQQITNLGENMIWIEAGGRQVNGVRTGTYGTKSLTMEDAKAIAAQVSLVTNISRHVDTHVQVIYGSGNWNTTVRGVTPEYLSVRKWDIARGASFFTSDVESAANVCLLGQTVVDYVFGEEDPLGKTIRVNAVPCKVIGVLTRKGLSPFGQDQDDTILMPVTTVQKKIKGIDWLDDIMCSGVTPDSIPAAEKQITALLRERHHLRPDEDDDFNLRHPADIAQTRAQSEKIMTLLLASIASISLVVGGIGIMNIMLVSVTERTREIGVRLAVGATESDVQMQFLSEATVLSLVGGVAGILVGIAGSYVISRTLSWPTLIQPFAIAVAAVFSAAVGLFFGFYPARKAARLDPIEALRYE